MDNRTEQMWERQRRDSANQLIEILNMAITDGIITEDQARAIIPLPQQSRNDGRSGPIPFT